MTSTTDGRIGAALQELREHLGVTQARLAEEMSGRGHPWHQQTVVKTEKGLRPLRLSEACDLAAVLGVGLDQLTGLGETRVDHLALRGHIARCEEADRSAQLAQAAAASARSSLRMAALGADDLPAELRTRVDALLAPPED